MSRVDNLDLNIRRAKRLWKEEDNPDRDLAQAKDEFSKTKFTYLELLTKSEFVHNIIEQSTVIVPDSSEAEESLAQAKASLKKSKGRCKALKTELEEMLVEVCRKEAELQSNALEFVSKPNPENIAISEESEEIIQDLQSKIASKQTCLEAQEVTIRELNRQKTELELSVKGLDSKIENQAPPDHNAILARKMSAWYSKANVVLGELCGVESIDVKENQVVLSRKAVVGSRLLKIFLSGRFT